MGLKCKITTTSTGNKVVNNEDGSINKLFAQALEYTKNEEKALNLWASSYLPEFKIATGKNEDNATLQDVINFMTTPVEERLSNEEQFEVKEFMKRNNISSLSKLSKVLNDVFKPNGVFEISIPRAVASGLYSQEEAFDLNPREVIDIVTRVQSHLTKEDFSVEPESGKLFSKNSGTKTILGTYRKATEKEVDEDLFNSLEKGMTLDEAISESPFKDFSDQYYNSKTFREKLKSRIDSLKRAPIVSIVDGQLSLDNNTYLTTLKNTIGLNINPAIVDAELEYLVSIDEGVWNTMQPQIKAVLREVEEDFVNINIDVIGLSNISNDKEGVVNVLVALSKVVKDPTDAHLKEFADLFSTKVLQETVEPSTLEYLDEAYKDLAIVKLDTNLSDNELFSDQGLIKVAEGLYHKVKRGQVTQMYEYLYNQVVDGNSPVKIKADINNKEAVLKELSIFINSRNTGLKVDNKEEVSLNQVVFDHKRINAPSKSKSIQNLSSIKTDKEYLKHDFVEEFYNYTLREKLKNSEVYKTTLSKFRFTDNDITLVGTIDSVDNLDMSEELLDYIRLKRESSMDYLLPPATGIVDEDTFFQNFPDEAQVFPNEILTEGPFILTTNTAGTYKKLGDVLYKKVIVEGEKQLFTRVNTDTDVTYFNTSTDVKFDAKQAKDFMNVVNYNLSTTTSEKVADTVDSFKEPFRPTQTIQKRDQTRLLSEYMKQALGLDINIFTEAQMKEELARRGYDSIEAMVEAWHVSDDNFSDFNKQFIGQRFGTLFGYGFYFTSDEKNSEFFTRNYTINIGKENLTGIVATYYVDNKINRKLTDEEFLSALEDTLEDKDVLSNMFGESFVNDLLTIKEAIESNSAITYNGRYKYKVSLRGEFLQYTEKVPENTLSQVDNTIQGPITGEQLYKMLSEKLGGEKKASEYLVRKGISGMTYPMSLEPGGSDPQANGYVVFDENAITIENQIQFLKEGEMVYGFYDPNTDQMFLTEELLNPNTLVHEYWHLYKPVIRKATESGDQSAKLLLDSMDDLVNQVFNEEEFNKRFDSFLGKTNNLDFSGNEDFQIVGEKGAQRDAEAYAKLQEAKKLYNEGVEKSVVEATTGWSEYKGKWTYFDANVLKQLKFKNNTFPEVGVETTLGEVIEDNILFKYYPELKNIKVEHEYGMDEGQFARTSSEDGTKIWINEARAVEAYRGAYLGGIGRAYDEITLEDSIVASYVHEIAHIIQDIELLPSGGDPYTVIRRSAELIGEKATISPTVIKKIDEKLKEDLTDEDKKVLQATKIVLENLLNGNPGAAQLAYEMLYGEVEARTIELAYLKLRNNDLQDGVTLSELKDALAKQEGISLEDQLVVSRPFSDKQSRANSSVGFSAVPANKGFYSNAKVALENLKDKNVKNVQGWVKALTDVQKNGGIKNVNQELEWIGLEEYLNNYIKENNSKNGNISFDVVNDFVQSNQIKVVTVNNDIAAYSEYQLKGGENYREVLLTMPSDYKSLTSEEEEIFLGRKDAPKDVVREIMRKELEYNTYNEKLKEGVYKSGHWSSENILAHVRLNEKTLPDGRKVLVVNEIQSDWAQEGRKRGFIGKEVESQREALRLKVQDQKRKVEDKELELESLVPLSKEETSELEREIKKLQDTQSNVRNTREFNELEKEILDRKQKLSEYSYQKDILKNDIYELKYVGESSLSKLEDNLYNFDKENPELLQGVPDMPYKNTDQWVSLVMRRILQMATQEGYDGIALATGQQSADMYSLSNQVDKIDITPQEDIKAVYISMKNNTDDAVFINKEGVITESASGVYNGKKADEVLGKDLTRKILETEEATTLEGEDLEFGGEGMKTFYDKIVTKVAQKEAQRFDKSVKLEEINFSSNLTSSNKISQGDKPSLGKQPFIPITISMRESLNKAVPLFQAANLDASVYDPRQGESREQYISRMKEEIEANMLGANAEEYLSRIADEAGLNDAQKKSFLDRVKKFINQFSSWIANQLGFKALTPEQASKLTTKDLLDKVTTSMLKDDYGKKVGNIQSILDSNLEFLDLYSEKDNIQEKMNACG